jgi:hypothetical protein
MDRIRLPGLINIDRDLPQICNCFVIGRRTNIQKNIIHKTLLSIARLLLEYTGTKYEDKKLACGPAPTFDRSAWTDQKFSLGLDFPNLPYYIDEEVRRD